ncbi:hypothetical protein [Arthrobacter sp. H41]|uniref:hypothetical protein n=1 Tax=Arthrobacter sp. H41 TaxID=1312978 RepID=UPI000479256E|nr:hypothetical protein [Arthrobacter sp. H41]
MSGGVSRGAGLQTVGGEVTDPLDQVRGAGIGLVLQHLDELQGADCLIEVQTLGGRAQQRLQQRIRRRLEQRTSPTEETPTSAAVDPSRVHNPSQPPTTDIPGGAEKRPVIDVVDGRVFR